MLAAAAATVPDWTVLCAELHEMVVAEAKKGAQELRGAPESFREPLRALGGLRARSRAPGSSKLASTQPLRDPI